MTPEKLNLRICQGYTVFSIPVGVVYRPNEAKVKNLKTKDYLGKARLIAASDRSSAPTGHKRTQSALDDRGGEIPLHIAAQLAQKAASGRSRQHSEPPLNRNLFPPTPPPDPDKAGAGSSAAGLGLNSRPGSVRAARPPRLDLDRPGAHITGRNGTDPAPLEKPRIGTTRTASEPRGPSSRPYSRGLPSGPEPTRGRPLGHRRGASETNFPVGAPLTHAEEGYGSYPRPPANGGRRGAPRQQERYIDEEEEYASEAYEEDGAADEDFELVGARSRPRSPARNSRRAASRRPEVRKFRVKVHAHEDTRYIMIGPAVEFGEFERKIREKFGFNSLLKIKMQDEGDMITMVDQEDLDLLVASARETARREASEMGKMEVRYPARLPSATSSPTLTLSHRSGLKNAR